MRSYPRGQIPIEARRTAGALQTAISCMGAFWTPAAERIDGLGIPASKNLHLCGSGAHPYPVTSSAAACNISKRRDPEF